MLLMLLPTRGQRTFCIRLVIYISLIYMYIHVFWIGGYGAWRDPSGSLSRSCFELYLQEKWPWRSSGISFSEYIFFSESECMKLWFTSVFWLAILKSKSASSTLVVLVLCMSKWWINLRKYLTFSGFGLPQQNCRPFYKAVYNIPIRFKWRRSRRLCWSWALW